MDARKPQQMIDLTKVKETILKPGVHLVLVTQDEYNTQISMEPKAFEPMFNIFPLEKTVGGQIEYLLVAEVPFLLGELVSIKLHPCLKCIEDLKAFTNDAFFLCVPVDYNHLVV